MVVGVVTCDFGGSLLTPAGVHQDDISFEPEHGLGFTVAFVFFVLACIGYTRNAVRQRHWALAAYTAISAAAAVVLAMPPGNNAIAVRDLIAATLLWAWITSHAIRLLRAGRSRPSHTPASRAPERGRAHVGVIHSRQRGV